MDNISLHRYNALAGYSRLPSTLLLSEEIEWFEHSSGRLLGVLIRDQIDGDFGGIVMGRDERRRFRCIHVTDFSDFIGQTGVAGRCGTGVAGRSNPHSSILCRCVASSMEITSFSKRHGYNLPPLVEKIIDEPQQSASGTGIAQASGEGASASVYISGLTSEQIAPLLQAPGTAQQARIDHSAEPKPGT
jgi:hypothetical protein